MKMTNMYICRCILWKIEGYANESHPRSLLGSYLGQLSRHEASALIELKKMIMILQDTFILVIIHNSKILDGRVYIEYIRACEMFLDILLFCVAGSQCKCLFTHLCVSSFDS